MNVVTTINSLWTTDHTVQSEFAVYLDAKHKRWDIQSMVMQDLNLAVNVWKAKCGSNCMAHEI